MNALTHCYHVSTGCYGPPHGPCNCSCTTCVPPTSRLSALERRGLMSLLGETVEHLVGLGFDGPIGNGNYCRACKRSGGGSIEQHAPDCSGVRLLREIREVLAGTGR